MQTASFDYLNVAKKVHRELIDKFTYVSDIEKYGNDEFWTNTEVARRTLLGAIISARYFGDCEDYAILCRKRLREKGYNSRLIYSETSKGTFHVFCLVGNMVLDVRHKWLMSLTDILEDGDVLHVASGFEPRDPWRAIVGLEKGDSIG